MADPNTITDISRPKTIEEIVGLEEAKKIIHYDVLGSVKLNQVVSSYILNGPPGTGKSTLGDIIAGFSKRTDGSPAEIHKRLGSDLRSTEDFIDLANCSKDGDVIFIEEAHTMGGAGPKSKICQAVLLEWIENFQILAEGVQAPKVCFVLPTTNPGRLTNALRTRCTTIHTGYYSVEEIEQILSQAGTKCDMDLMSDPEALRLLARSSRGTPRTAVMHRLDRLRKVMAVDELEYSLEAVQKFLQTHNINEWGLESGDIRYCHILYEKMEQNGGRPVSRKILEQSTGFSPDMLDMVIESYLQQINVIRMESRGRVLTDFGFSVIGEEPIRTDTIEEFVAQQLDKEKLAQLLEDPEIRSGGLKALVPKLGFQYGKHNSMVKGFLAEMGYTSKQRVGIVKI